MKSIRRLFVPTLLLASVMFATIALAGGGYPRKSVLVQSSWNCWKRDGTYFVMSLRSDDRYARSQPLGGSGNYRYNRSVGKVDFRSGPQRDHFGKLSEGLGGWDMTVKDDSSRRTWGFCQNYTAGMP